MATSQPTKLQRARIAALERRIRFLDDQLSGPASERMDYARAERSALRWALEMISVALEAQKAHHGH